MLFFDKYLFKIERVIFNENFLTVYIDNKEPLSLNKLTEMYKFLLDKFIFGLSRNMSKNTLRIGVCNNGALCGKWFMSFPLNSVGFRDLKRYYRYIKDGDEFVICLHNDLKNYPTDYFNNRL